MRVTADNTEASLNQTGVKIYKAASNFNLHVANPTTKDSQFGLREFKISLQHLYTLSEYNSQTRKYQKYNLVDPNTHQDKLYPKDILANIPLETSLSIPQIISEYNDTLFDLQDTKMLLFQKVKLNVTYLIPGRTSVDNNKFNITKEFDIESQMCAISKTTNTISYNTHSPENKRYILYKKQL